MIRQDAVDSLRRIEAYSDPCQLFLKKAPSQMFDRILNMH